MSKFFKQSPEEFDKHTCEGGLLYLRQKSDI